MPWKDVCPMDQRRQFVLDARRYAGSWTELCARYQICRKTGYQWLARADADGLEALGEHAGHGPAACRRSTIRLTTKSASSAGTAGSAGTPSGSTSVTCSPNSTSASRRSTTANGICTLDRSNSGAFTSACCGSRMPSAGSAAGDSYRCPRTDLLPMSPAAQFDDAPRLWILPRRLPGSRGPQRASTS